MSDSEKRVHFRVSRFIYESGLKLRLDSIPMATATTLYHLFFKENDLKDYDPFLIGMTCLSLACKAEEKMVHLGDIVNVCYRTLHKSKAPLEIGDTHRSLKESVSTWELCLLRAFGYKVVFDHPHRYLCHYLKAMGDWVEPRLWESVPIQRSAWTFLRDSYMGDMCLKYKSQHLAVSVLYFSFLCHGVEVPCQRHAKTKWWKVFSSDISLDQIQDIITDLMNLYSTETQIRHRDDDR